MFSMINHNLIYLFIYLFIYLCVYFTHNNASDYMTNRNLNKNDIEYQFYI